MGMAARTLDALNFRSFASYELELDRGVTILVGRNAAGKTNLIEALQLLTAGQSFRKPRTGELLREGSERGRIELLMEGDGRSVRTACELEEGKRSFLFNGKRVQAGGIRGTLPSVLFCPDHLDMVKRSASVRREALDSFGVQLNAQYAKLSSSYDRIVTQRNSLLKDPECPPDLLRAWSDSLVSTGSSLLMHRIALLERIRGRFRSIYATIAPHEQADLSYETSIGGMPGSREEAAGMFEAALEASAEDEARRGVTLVGPHRDEILFTIDGRPAREYGSQGQQRSIVLAWKIAEVQVTRDILGQNPILLLDDVMSELDAARRESIVSFVEGEIQTVITTTNLGYFSSGILDGAKVVAIGDE